MDQRTHARGAGRRGEYRSVPADGTRLGDNTDGAGLVREIIENHRGGNADRRIPC
jgi:hypothetical protein